MYSQKKLICIPSWMSSEKQEKPQASILQRSSSLYYDNCNFSRTEADNPS